MRPSATEEEEKGAARQHHSLLGKTQHCHGKSPTCGVRKFNSNIRSSSSSSSSMTNSNQKRTCCCRLSTTDIFLICQLGLLLFLAFSIHNSLLNTQQIMLSMYSFQSNNAPTATAAAATPTFQETVDPIQAQQQQQQQQCSRNGTKNTMSFEELVRTHYEKLRKEPSPAAPVSSSSNNKDLKFVHIAKTGGTAIEMAAAAGNISWGVCHWHNGKYYKQHRCPTSSSLRQEPSRVTTNGGIPRIAYWHKTSQHYNVRAPGKRPDDVDAYDPYANASLFAVVRNPYHRIISEYYYDTSRGKTPAHVLNNATRLNTWVSQMLRPLQGATMGFIQLVPTGSETVVLPANRHYYQRDSHYLPQYDYFYDGERRVVQHAIHFEHLSNEFPQLMEQYNLSHKVILPEVNHHDQKHQEAANVMSGRHTPNKQLDVHNLTLENTRLIEFVYARDFVFFGYPARTHVLENQYHPPGSVAAPASAAGNRRRRRRRLEFVHIPQTGGRMIEKAAAAARIPWGACHFASNSTRIENNTQRSLSSTSQHDDKLSWCPVAHTNKQQLLDPNEMHKLLPATLLEMKNHLWNLPSHYFEKLLSATTIDPSSKGLLNPYGDDGDAALFVVVRNPYDRVISTYYSVHEKENQAADGSMAMMMNDATYMNEWLYRHLVAMRGTISTASQVDASSFPNNPAYYQFAGRFIPQYDFVYDFVYDDKKQGQRRVVDHVLHFESLTTEFPALMNDYYGNDNGRPTVPEIKDTAKLEALLGCTQSRSLGIANLTMQNVRLIEFVYARDFAAFGYKSMTYHLENQYPPNSSPTIE